MNLQDALKHTATSRERLATNREVDSILLTGLSALMGQIVLTGTVAVYQAPNAPFGESVVYQDITFNVPKEFQELSNAALVLENPYIKNGIMKGKNIRLVADFPTEFGCYPVDENTGLPHGTRTGASERQARYLWRADSGIHPVIRSGGLADWRIVDMSQKLDVSQRAVFVSQGQGAIVVPKGPVAALKLMLRALDEESKLKS
ncbi:MAG: hypothetical protein ACYCO0_04970 [Candidatus Micrarchaeaceae archaeon]